MRCLSLHQPWASLIACGQKRIETRSWLTSYRGLVAIHAAKQPVDEDLCTSEPFHTTMLEAGLEWQRLPLGMVVAIARLELVAPVEIIQPQLEARIRRGNAPRHEIAFGNWSPGRFGWLFVEVNPLRVPYPMRGMQGLFKLSALHQVQIKQRQTHTVG